MKEDSIQTVRKYGNPPFSTAVIHGGPGAPGEMAPVAKELAKNFGILESLQSANTLSGQIDELKQQVKENSKTPIALIGWSWGAWLSFMFTAQNPSMVKKLILIGSGPFEDKYVPEIMQIRLSRLSKEDGEKVSLFTQLISNAKEDEKDKIFCQFGSLLSKADLYNSLPHENDIIECQYNVYEGVWKDAKELRSTGKLLEYGKKITCPVVAIHGDGDPHPAKGVQEPLSKIINDFKFILLENCGHKPWYEKEARDRFYELLREELIQEL
ncbi:MAG: alpha/beta hydrolase [Actinobacteria bacterium]|nr:alpha/beta hydrolase [Actinomycetota bacterium]